MIQQLASDKKLGLVISDRGLVLGVNMPIDTVVITGQNCNMSELTSSITQQMAGRAGRKGLSKKGNIIYCNIYFISIKNIKTCF